MGGECLFLYWAFASSEKNATAGATIRCLSLPMRKASPFITSLLPAPWRSLPNSMEVMPALCNPDYAGMELIHARLIRTTTGSNGCKCDYTICGDRDEYAKAHPEYVDERGYRRNG